MSVFNASLTMMNQGDSGSSEWQPLNDGYSNFWFELTDDTLSPWLKFSAKTSNATIDWGDGSGEVALDTLTPTHTYSKAGKYVVKVKGVTGITRQHTPQYNSPYTKVLKYAELNSEINAFTSIAFGVEEGLIKFVFDGTTCNISSSSFIHCGSLENIILPSALTEIGSQTFYNCLSLREITIPSSVTSIGGSAFQLCIQLKSIHIQATTPPTIGANIFSALSTQDNYTIYVPVGTLSAYQTAWSAYADHIVEEGQTPTRAMVAKFGSAGPGEEEEEMR